MKSGFVESQIISIIIINERPLWGQAVWKLQISKYSWVGLPFPTQRKRHSARFERPTFEGPEFFCVFTQRGAEAARLRH